MRENRTYGSVRGGGSNAVRLLDSDPSAGWLPRGRCHTVSLFFVAFRHAEANTGGGAPEEQAINLGGPGAEPPRGYAFGGVPGSGYSPVVT